MEHFISYPRTAAELADTLKLGMEEILRLLRERKLRVNLRVFLRSFFKSNKGDRGHVIDANEKLLAWYANRLERGGSAAALVYHHTGVRALHGFTIQRITYERKADRSRYQAEREREFHVVRKGWIKEIATHRADELKGAGFSAEMVADMVRTGKPPQGYQVHHRIPLDDGGTNAHNNLILIQDNVEHRAVHGYYNPGEQRIKDLAYGDISDVALPMPPEDTVVYPNPSLGYVAEPLPNVEFLEIFA